MPCARRWISQTRNELRRLLCVCSNTSRTRARCCALLSPRKLLLQVSFIYLSLHPFSPFFSLSFRPLFPSLPLTLAIEGTGTLFRSNSMAMKLLSVYAQFTGQQYLRATLAAPISDIVADARSVEVLLRFQSFLFNFLYSFLPRFF